MMTGRPVETVAAAVQDPEGRQGIWDEIRALGGRAFTQRDLNGATPAKERTISYYLSCLVAAGYLERIEGGELLQWRQLKDCPLAPRLRRDGTPQPEGGGTTNMWRAMRMLPQFTPRELAVHSTTGTVSVSEDAAKSYVQDLLAAGYLKVIRKASPAKGQAIYCLIRNTGPLAPKVRRVRTVFDPNLKPSRATS